MDEIEVIQAKIPSEIYEKKVINLINILLELDEILFQEEEKAA